VSSLEKARLARRARAEATPSLHCAFGHSVAPGWYGWQHSAHGYAECPHRHEIDRDSELESTLPLEDD
jgi:hypothetical protein